MRIKFLVAALLLPLSLPVEAALAPGAAAPTFTAAGAMAGKPYSVDLKAALKKGPVVLYFFPAAFTDGCNAEAAAFAAALPDFTKAGATVIGMTAGNVDQLAAFSSKHCAGKFAVAAASPAVIKGYDVLLKKPDGTPTTITSRTSYVIAPNGKILFAHTDMNPGAHIRLTLDAVRKFRAGKRA
ncbi:redoxin domain-containing protein [Sphingomonas psychrotolerans]|uniref:thioredoxin-dependent peroxiredoxin n=1 Tax=Sphingomonas psychrotolerans TaxID=1327635 RepID=A0ABU3N636_9SPHN|nr:redoxin domain-containing protein [Sphingomonas psychrotolerans]MDT8759309.1 redoxin domain-containing protein [Sphingomonas psychrotolerans]